MLNIGILGCGRIGQVHARSVNHVDGAHGWRPSPMRFPTAASALAEKTDAEVMGSDEIIASPDIDAVVIGTPTDTHFDLIQARCEGRQGDLLRKAGRHVIGPDPRTASRWWRPRACRS
jgi:predicted dehydrogenase